MKSVGDPIMLVFPRHEVESGDLKPFHRRFGPDVLPNGQALLDLMGRCNFIVDGYDEDPEEIYAIEAVRRYYQKLHEEWPYWLFFCDLRTENLLMMTMCCMSQLTGQKDIRQPIAKVEIDPSELVRFISGGFNPMNAMFERAEATEMEIYERTRDVFGYYHLPFDAPPPD